MTRPLAALALVICTATATVRSQSHAGQPPQGPPPRPTPAAAPVSPVRLVSPAEHDRRTALIPASADGVLEALRNSPHLVWYDEEVMPPLFQHWEPATVGGHVFGVVDARVNISADKPRELYGNANREFPWRATAGVRPDQPVLRFAVLPAPARMKWVGNAAHRFDNGGVADARYLHWAYADGTVFGELIGVTHPTTGRFHAVEVRLRRKEGTWSATAYRPFPTAASLRAALPTLDLPRDDFKSLVLMPAGLPSPREVRLRNPHPGRRVIDAAGTREMLPGPLDPATVVALLDRPFHDCEGVSWLDRDDRPPCHAPTTTSDFHVVPKDYDAAALEVSRKSCHRCHSSVLAEAGEFDAKRDWYGRVRGSDTIFSFHPFRPELAGTRVNRDRTRVVSAPLVGRLFVWE